MEEYGGGGLKDTVPLLVNDPKMRQKRGHCLLAEDAACICSCIMSVCTNSANQLQLRGLGLKTDVLLF